MQILSERQLRALEFLAGQEYIKNNFYLTGGTALVAYSLHHRYSEDLDFFSEQEVLGTTNTLFRRI
ncbi:MAG: nucleotidyl transferase AbiEii/AbiGii toxin family protein [bacterium]|nr:nucleotidyl transferase AbiEii/AbiGii toxin family protein [bacterium]